MKSLIKKTFGIVALAALIISGTTACSLILTLALTRPGGWTITTGTTLPGGIVDEFYSQGFNVKGRTPIEWWDIDSGNLPDGLSIDPKTGVISGTPRVADTFTFTVIAGNDTADVTKEFTITISPAPVAPNITTTTLPYGPVNELYSQTLAATGAAPITWSHVSGSLPDGLSLDPGTGVISGTPTVQGTFTFTIRADNAVGYDDQNLSIQITGPNVSIQLVVEAELGAGNVHVFENSFWLDVKITNPGTTPTGTLTITLTNLGSPDNSFEVNPSSLSIPSILGGDSATFSVRPNNAVAEPTSESRITVSGGPNVTVNNHTFVVRIRPGMVFVKDNSEPTLRAAITNASAGSIISMWPDNTLDLPSPLEINKNLIIEGNSSTLTPVSVGWPAGFDSPLMNINASTATINSLSFNNGDSRGQGTAITITGHSTVTLQSSIFTQGIVGDGFGGIGGGDSSAVWIDGPGSDAITLNVLGCTFYGNKNISGPVAIAASSAYSGIATVTLTGNLFYGNVNQIDNPRPLIFQDSRIVLGGVNYNVVDHLYSPGDAYGHVGWVAGTGDRTFSGPGPGGLGIVIPDLENPFDTTPHPIDVAGGTYAPGPATATAAALRTVMPGTAIPGFPLTDFNGELRWPTGGTPGAPGAVR